MKAEDALDAGGIKSLQHKMEVALAVSFQGSMLCTKHFGQETFDRKNPSVVPRQFRTYILENNTHLLNDELMSKAELDKVLRKVIDFSPYPDLRRSSKKVLEKMTAIAAAKAREETQPLKFVEKNL